MHKNHHSSQVDCFLNRHFPNLYTLIPFRNFIDIIRNEFADLWLDLDESVVQDICIRIGQSLEVRSDNQIDIRILRRKCKSHGILGLILQAIKDLNYSEKHGVTIQQISEIFPKSFTDHSKSSYLISSALNISQLPGCQESNSNSSNSNGNDLNSHKGRALLTVPDMNNDFSRHPKKNSNAYIGQSEAQIEEIKRAVSKHSQVLLQEAQRQLENKMKDWSVTIGRRITHFEKVLKNIEVQSAELADRRKAEIKIQDMSAYIEMLESRLQKYKRRTTLDIYSNQPGTAHQQHYEHRSPLQPRVSPSHNSNNAGFAKRERSVTMKEYHQQQSDNKKGQHMILKQNHSPKYATTMAQGFRFNKN